MNNIIFAGDRSGEIINKRYEIIAPFKETATIKLPDGTGVEIAAGSFAVIPPSRPYSCEAGDKIHAVLERALLTVKEICVIKDAENAIYPACNQAANIFKSDYKNKNAVLSALGGLIVSFVNLYDGESKKYSPCVELIVADIEKNLSNSAYSLEDFLRKMPLNYDYLRKLFKKETGATPHGYLVRRRMSLAEQLISGGLANKYSEYTVAQLAEACGYSEPLYFSRVFKKYYNASPSEYIKKE